MTTYHAYATARTGKLPPIQHAALTVPDRWGGGRALCGALVSRDLGHDFDADAGRAGRICERCARAVTRTLPRGWGQV